MFSYARTKRLENGLKLREVKHTTAFNRATSESNPASLENNYVSIFTNGEINDLDPQTPLELPRASPQRVCSVV
jgi:hypothetical protein